VDELVVLQRELLAAAAELVRPVGTLVYSVCTLTKTETEGIDEWLAGALRAFDAEPPPGEPWLPLGRGARLLPQTADTDGMYVLGLRRKRG
jgi:16S rRNA (cytosine967-C5)-methyltransferase